LIRNFYVADFSIYTIAFLRLTDVIAFDRVPLRDIQVMKNVSLLMKEGKIINKTEVKNILAV